MEKLVVDEMQEWARPTRPTGYVIYGAPFEMEIILDYTGLRGTAANIYYAFTHKLGKWRYVVRKVDEWMEVNPEYTELWNATLAQKQRLEGAIKSGLTSATQAVADYELVKHDARRYREILDFFVQGKKDPHVLRSLFVDRVDAFTGEGYSMITMAKRWPTIITDFIRMEEKLDNVDNIRKTLDVSQAEATVLKTKNELFKEWRTVFFPVVKERYARLENLVRARNRSIEEYRNWLKPYIAKYKAIKEKTEESPASFVSNAFMTPGFGTSDATTAVRLWFWRSFPIPEKGKQESVLEKTGKGFVVDPYDDFVRKWKARIEERYNLTITDEEVRGVLERAIKPPKDTYVSEMYAYDPYYILWDASILLQILRSPPPEGKEVDNLMVIPIKLWFCSQNAILIHLLEIYAREKAMENYINEIIGASKIEEDILKKVEQEFLEKKKEKGPGFFEKMQPAKKRLKPHALKFAHFFVKPGPYETVFFERVSKMYARGSGFYYKQIIDFLKTLMHIE